MTLAIQGNVEVLKKDDGSYLFPVTVTEAIKDSGTDKTLKQVIDEFETNVDSQLAQDAQDLQTHKAEIVSKVVLITEPYNQLTKTTVNLGFKPKLIFVDACILSQKYTSNGYVDQTNAQYTKYLLANDSSLQTVGNVAIRLAYDLSNYIQGIVAITSSGVEITWVNLGTINTAGNRRIIVSAFAHGGV